MIGARFLQWILRRKREHAEPKRDAGGRTDGRGRGHGAFAAGGVRSGGAAHSSSAASGGRRGEPGRGADGRAESTRREAAAAEGRRMGAGMRAMQASRAAWGKAGAADAARAQAAGGPRAGGADASGGTQRTRAEAAAAAQAAGYAPASRAEAAAATRPVTTRASAQRTAPASAKTNALGAVSVAAPSASAPPSAAAASASATATAPPTAEARASAPASAPGAAAGGGKRQRSRLRPLLWAAGPLLIAGAAGLGLGAQWVRSLDISKLEHPLPEPSFIMDAAGEPVSQLSSSRIVPVRIDQIPLDLRNAVIAVEDRRFYDHSGFDLLSIGRAVVRDLKAGTLKEGGSTITQQLAKNLFLESDKTMSRKLKELGYAIKINFTYSKDEILELYLNSIYFGEGRWGVEGAAQQYFGKPVEQLTLPESALLAGLPKAPSTYSPVKNKEKALERRNLVLSLMKEQHFISEDAYRQAVAAPIELKPNNGESLKGKHPAFVDHVMDEAEKLYGFTEQQILTMGLRIYTTMDAKVQQAAEEVYANGALFPESPADQLVQSGIAVIDQHTGGIRAIVGGRGEQVYRGFNHATELKRQPGSSFKPLAVYGPALERGYTPDSMLYDGELNIAGYSPKDWDGRTRGQVSMREALKSSWNIPAVWLLNEIGIDAGMDFVRRAGISLPKADRSLSIALGGLSEGVSPLLMAQAYSAIANQGVMHPAHAITKITTKDGHPLVEAAAQPVQVTSPAVAYTLTALLQDVVAAGSGRVAALSDRPVAGKSGTTQLPATAEFAEIGTGGSKDAWFVGFTPELTAAVWLGYDQTDRKHYLTTSGGAVPAQLFREVLARSLKDVPPAAFPVPEEVRRAVEQAQRAAEQAQQAAAQRDKPDVGNGHKPGPKDRGPSGKGKKNDD